MTGIKGETSAMVSVKGIGAANRVLGGGFCGGARTRVEEEDVAAAAALATRAARRSK